MFVFETRTREGVRIWFETYEMLEVFLDAMIVTSKGEERDYWMNDADYIEVDTEEI